MAQASEDILESVVLIYGTHGKEFGTGFVIHAEHGTTWILTCAHVVKKVAHIGADAIQVRGRVAEVVACGKEEEADLAVLRVAGLELPSLKLGLVGRNAMACDIAGYAKLTGDAMRAEPLSATLGSSIRIEVRGGLPFKAWKLSIEGDTQLQEGYSGSPVVCTATLTVFAVASHEEHQGERGYAVSLYHLREIWPAMPVGLVSPEPHTSAWLAQEQRDVLEDLFRTLNVR